MNYSMPPFCLRKLLVVVATTAGKNTIDGHVLPDDEWLAVMGPLHAYRAITSIEEFLYH